MMLVICPAGSSRQEELTISASVSRSPSTSVATSRLTRSSCGRGTALAYVGEDVFPHFAHGLADHPPDLDVPRVFDVQRDQPIGPGAEQFAVVDRDAVQLGDHHHGQRVRDLLDQSDITRCTAVCRRIWPNASRQTGCSSRIVPSHLRRVWPPSLIRGRGSTGIVIVGSGGTCVSFTIDSSDGGGQGLGDEFRPIFRRGAVEDLDGTTGGIGQFCGRDLVSRFERAPDEIGQTVGVGRKIGSRAGDLGVQMKFDETGKQGVERETVGRIPHPLSCSIRR
ncbi:hypothetical protein ABT120_30420 [Nonomuraea angiospora]|uniref:hypothetical protein n=1 Tax=Nonomuraea angiospora TaxID=46172 RepID=UPI00331AC4E2